MNSAEGGPEKKKKETQEARLLSGVLLEQRGTNKKYRREKGNRHKVVTVTTFSLCAVWPIALKDWLLNLHSSSFSAIISSKATVSTLFMI